jgi:hypothetical protein
MVTDTIRILVRLVVITNDDYTSSYHLAFYRNPRSV